MDRVFGMGMLATVLQESIKTFLRGNVRAEGGLDLI